MAQSSPVYDSYSQVLQEYTIKMRATQNSGHHYRVPAMNTENSTNVYMPHQNEQRHLTNGRCPPWGAEGGGGIREYLLCYRSKVERQNTKRVEWIF